MAAAGGRVIAIQTLDLEPGWPRHPGPAVHPARGLGPGGRLRRGGQRGRSDLPGGAAGGREARGPAQRGDGGLLLPGGPAGQPQRGRSRRSPTWSQHGHRRIAFVGSLFQPDTRERLDAYREALTDHGIAPDDSLLFETSDNLEGSGEAAGRAMLAAGLPSTAVIAATDFNALGVMKALGDAGLSLPDDQAIVGFDDVEAASSVRPTLSSVRQSFRATGRSPPACSSRWWTGRAVAPGRHLVPTWFVPRESCGCADRLGGRGDRGARPGQPPDPTGPAALPAPAAPLRRRAAPARGVGDARRGRRAHRRVRGARRWGDRARRTTPAGRPPGALFSMSPRWTTITACVDCLRRYCQEVETPPPRPASLSRRASPRSCSSSPGRWPSASRRPTPPSTSRCAGSTSSAWG